MARRSCTGDALLAWADGRRTVVSWSPTSTASRSSWSPMTATRGSSATVTDLATAGSGAAALWRATPTRPVASPMARLHRTPAGPTPARSRGTDDADLPATAPSAPGSKGEPSPESAHIAHHPDPRPEATGAGTARQSENRAACYDPAITGGPTVDRYYSDRRDLLCCIHDWQTERPELRAQSRLRRVHRGCLATWAAIESSRSRPCNEEGAASTHTHLRRLVQMPTDPPG